MIGTREAATILGVEPITVGRWYDDGRLRGGRPTDPETGQPAKNPHRWVDARHVVAYAVAMGRGHAVPERWQYLVARQQTGRPRPRRPR